VREAIKDYISSNGLKPGDSLPPEAELAEQLAVGRNSVREAISALEALDIIQVRHGSGLFVGSFSMDLLLDHLPYGLLLDSDDLLDLAEARRLLESGMIEQAVRLRSDQQIEDLQRLMDAMRLWVEQGQQPLFEQDRDFHRKLFEGLGNRALLRVTDAFWLAWYKSTLYGRLADRDQTDIHRDRMRMYRNHAAIFEAFKAGDVARAHAAVDKHYGDSISRMEQALHGDNT
jgi:DNA-binding FadR family transcriptional regulator